MPKFKDLSNRVHSLDDAAFIHLLPAGCVEITDQEAANLTAPPPPTAEQVADATAKAEAKADNVVQYLRDHTPAECEAYVQANVTDLASARALMKKFAVVLCVLAKQTLR